MLMLAHKTLHLLTQRPNLSIYSFDGFMHLFEDHNIFKNQ